MFSSSPTSSYTEVMGGLCPSPRLRKRDSYRQKGKALLKDGKRSEAYECFQKCVDVSPEMALAFIKVRLWCEGLKHGY